MSPATRSEAPQRPALERRARAQGVATSYLDVSGRRQVASDTSLVAVLDALGEPVPGRGGARRTLGGRARVAVAWDGRLPPLRLPGPEGRGEAPLELLAEGAGAPARLATRPSGTGTLGVEAPLPLGVHELRSADGARLSWVVAAPSRAPALSGGDRPPWGVFAPAYALLDGRGRRSGDLSALGALGELVAPLGAGLVATLPLLAELSSAEGGGGQQPYAPLSRMWWNEGYLDLQGLPELADEKGASLVSAALATAGAPRRAPDGRLLADVAGAAGAARPALERAAGVLEEGDSPRRRAFEAFAASRPGLERYAAFRAAVEVAGPDLSRWPAAWRRGELGAAGLPRPALARHRYAQFATDEQLGQVAARLRSRGAGLLLDLPVGCRGGGYDPWADPEAFAAGASIGAPPDGFFTGGQDWGFPPPRPEADRARGYPMLRAVLAHNSAHARVLRVDHVLAWSRLWWVPAGMAPAEGAYVRYPTEELIAVACLEASRHGCALVGEDLGTVPRGLRPALRRHGVAGMRVAVFDLEERPERPLRPPAGTVAYVGTHDTATFAGFVSGADIDLRAGLGLTSAGAARSERSRRLRAVARLTERLGRSGALGPEAAADPLEVLGAVLEELGRSPAELVVVALEDLLGELDPQNLPGTTSEHDNFARTLAESLEALAGDPAVLGLLGRLDASRRQGLAGVAGVAGVAGGRAG